MRPPSHWHTDRLHLRPVELSDAPAIFAYAGRDGPTHFMPFSRHEKLCESEAFAKRCVEAWASGSAYPWAIMDRATDDFMGVIEMRVTPPTADFGHILDQPFWGHGYATEAASTVVAWAVAQPSIYRVWAHCHPDNAASAAVLRKAGLSYETTLANWEARPQRNEAAGPSHSYALTRPANGAPPA